MTVQLSIQHNSPGARRAVRVRAVDRSGQPVSADEILMPGQGCTLFVWQGVSLQADELTEEETRELLGRSPERLARISLEGVSITPTHEPRPRKPEWPAPDPGALLDRVDAKAAV